MSSKLNIFKLMTEYLKLLTRTNQMKYVFLFTGEETKKLNLLLVENDNE